MEQTSGWFNLASRLVWPIFIVGFLLFFHSDVSQLYKVLKDRVESGSSVKFGWLEIGEQADKTEIGTLVFPDLPVDAIGGLGAAVGKGSEETLRRLREALSTSSYRRVDTLIVDSRQSYSPLLLRDYINTLGVRFVVFSRDGRFDGWIEAGLFLTQVLSDMRAQRLTAEEVADLIISYDELKSTTAGVIEKAVQVKDSARTVLQAMQEGHTENLPVLDDKEFRFFANRGEILANLISVFILKE